MDIEQTREAMYDACRQMGLMIVPFDTAARVMAFIGLQGGDERVTASPKLYCEIRHIQKQYHIEGGEIPDKDFCELLQEYTRELTDYTNKHDGEWPEWLNKMIEERYGFKPYKL